jgi:hypothetical protein
LPQRDAVLLELRTLTPVARGKQRYVFVHPADPGLIVKVPTERYVRSRAGQGGKWYKKWHKSLTRSRHNLIFLREIKEHLALRAADNELPHHVQDTVGFVETDLGMGVVTRAVRGRTGELAPTLLGLLQTGHFTSEARGKLEAFFAWLLDSPVVVGDLHAGNLLYGYAEGIGEHFVIVDGLGEKNLIPLNSLSGRANSWSKARRIKRLRRQIAAHPTSEGAPPRQAS